MSEKIELFVQGEGISDIALVRVPREGTVRDVVEAAAEHGLRVNSEEGPLVMVEDTDEALDLDAPLQVLGITHRDRVHANRCRHVEVTVNYEAEQKSEYFPPSTTMKKVKKWVDGKRGFDLGDVDAAEHLLQICGSDTRPDEDTHIGSLVGAPSCSLCFDLVAKQRVEG